MTSLERAESVIGYGVDDIANAIEEAISVEREACAALADYQHKDHLDNGCDCTGASDTADAIRARSK